jgi:hypothetical protein
VLATLSAQGETVAIDPNLEIAQRMKEQFGFYITALTFTILGLATQTAKFGLNSYFDVAELLAWLFLFISGLSGLSRLELLPVAYESRFHAKGLKDEMENFQDHKSNGLREVTDGANTHAIDDVIENRQVLQAKAQTTMEKIEKSTPIKYRIQKWTFIIGISLVLLSRAAPPIKSLLLSACNAST